MTALLEYFDLYTKKNNLLYTLEIGAHDLKLVSPALKFKLSVTSVLMV